MLPERDVLPASRRRTGGRVVATNKHLGMLMPFDGTYEGDPRDLHCKACREPIMDRERAVRIDFRHGNAETRGMSGLYHRECSKPFDSFAAILNMDPW